MTATDRSHENGLRPRELRAIAALLSEPTIERALRILKSTGLIEWRQKHFQGLPVTHLRLAAQTEHWARDEGLLADDVETVRNSEPELEKRVREEQQALGRTSGERSQ